MQAHSIARAAAAGAVIVAAAFVLLARWPSRGPVTAVAPPEISLAVATDASELRVVPEPPAPDGDARVAAKVRELEAMSETYRNTTFLIAIRDAGYTCNELLRVYGGIDDSGKWTATCSEMLAYTVSVAGTGMLHVEPLLQYFDGTGPAVLPSESEPGRQPRLLFPPQELSPRPPPQR